MAWNMTWFVKKSFFLNLWFLSFIPWVVIYKCREFEARIKCLIKPKLAVSRYGLIFSIVSILGVLWAKIKFEKICDDLEDKTQTI